MQYVQYVFMFKAWFMRKGTGGNQTLNLILTQMNLKWNDEYIFFSVCSVFYVKNVSMSPCCWQIKKINLYAKQLLLNSGWWMKKLISGPDMIAAFYWLQCYFFRQHNISTYLNFMEIRRWSECDVNFSLTASFLSEWTVNLLSAKRPLHTGLL